MFISEKVSPKSLSKMLRTLTTFTTFQRTEHATVFLCNTVFYSIELCKIHSVKRTVCQKKKRLNEILTVSQHMLWPCKTNHNSKENESEKTQKWASKQVNYIDIK